RFEGSKVVDKSGAPKRVYHGTTAAFTQFEKGDIGFHFGGVFQAEARAEGEGANIRPVYLSIKNPLRIKDVEIFENAYAVADALRKSKNLSPEAKAKIKELEAIEGRLSKDDAMNVLRSIVQKDG